MNIAIQLINWGIGGTEKRFPTLLKYLIKNSDNNYYFVVNRYLASILRKINYLKGIEHIIYEVPVTQNFFSNFTDTPFVDFFKNSRIKIPGPNFLLHKLKALGRNIYISNQKFNWINDLDVVHMTFETYPYLFPRDIPRVIECQSNALRFINSRIIKYLLYNDNNLNYLFLNV